MITAVVFDGKNYDLWERAVRTALKAKNKIVFIDGTLTRPTPKENEEFSEADAWDMVNSMLCSWLLNVVDPKLRMSIAYSDTAKTMWDDMKKRYAMANTPKIHQLKANIADCKQGDLNVGDFYSKLMNLWNELSNLVKVPVCTCSGCKCGAASQIIAMNEEDKAHQFLVGLNDELYSTIRSQILALDPLPPLDKIFNLTQQEENHRTIMIARDSRNETGLAFAAREQASMVEKGACKICGRYGHAEAACYEVIGYPPSWGPRGRGRGGRGGRVLGKGGRGHARNSRGSGVRELVAAVQQDKGLIRTDPTPGGQINIPGLSSEQTQRLLSLIDGPAGGYEKLSGNVSWMLDSGASSHMAGDVTLLNKVEKIPPVAIGLPNGTYTMAQEQGSVALARGLELKKVLYVPRLNCNLVSISKLCKQLNCSVTYFDDVCVIQDRTSRTLIGAGEQREGVYYYKESKVNQVNAVSTRGLWHKRLGHPSSDVLSLLPRSLGLDCGSTKAKDEFCEICLRAKQTRHKFSISKNNARHVFDLIHCDILGPYRIPSSCGAHYFLSVVDDASRATWVYLIKDRTEASKQLKSFILMVKTQFGKGVKVVRSDNGSEFVSRSMQEFYSEHGIVRESSCVDTPQQNGRVERKHRHILNVARALRFQANLPIHFWGECVLTAVFLINRTPSKLLNGKTPYEALLHRKPSFDEIRVFGTLCFVRTNPRAKDKFVPRSTKCVFVGYPFGKKG